MIISLIFFVISLIFFVLSIFSFLEKGILLNNAYLYATEKQRKNMNKKPYYRQSAVVFFLFGVVFLLDGCSQLFQKEELSYGAMGVMVFAAVYVLASNATIQKKEG